MTYGIGCAMLHRQVWGPAAAPMHRSAEHILLRLLTPAMLVFLLSHLMSSFMDGGAPRHPPPPIGTTELESSSSLAKAGRQSRLQVRKSRKSEAANSASAKPAFWSFAVAFLFVQLIGPASRRGMPAVAGDPDRPKGFALLRTRNPRDPPAAS